MCCVLNMHDKCLNLIFNIVAFHGKGGPLVITEAHTSPMEFLHRSAAIEKGLPVVDCNGYNQIGTQTFILP